MEIFWVINKLYTDRKCDWITEMSEDVITTISPYLIQRFLCMNDNIRIQVRWLDKYVFNVDTRMYLSLAWSILPKTDRAPYINYIKQLDKAEEFDFILSKVRQQFKLSDNDFKSNKKRLIQAIKKDMINWFSYYGVEKVKWKQYFLDFNKIKEFNNTKKETGSLAEWGL